MDNVREIEIFALGYRSMFILSAISQTGKPQLLSPQVLSYVASTNKWFQSCYQELPLFADYFRQTLRQELLRRHENGESTKAFTSNIATAVRHEANAMIDITTVLHDLWVDGIPRSQVNASSQRDEAPYNGTDWRDCDTGSSESWNSNNDGAWNNGVPSGWANIAGCKDGSEDVIVQPGSASPLVVPASTTTIWPKTLPPAPPGPPPPPSPCMEPPGLSSWATGLPSPTVPATSASVGGWDSGNPQPQVGQDGSILQGTSALARCVFHWIKSDGFATPVIVADRLGCTGHEARTALDELTRTGALCSGISSGGTQWYWQSHTANATHESANNAQEPSQDAKVATSKSVSALARCIHHWMKQQVSPWDSTYRWLDVSEVAVGVGCTIEEAQLGLDELYDVGDVDCTDDWHPQYRAQPCVPNGDECIEHVAGPVSW